MSWNSTKSCLLEGRALVNHTELADPSTAVTWLMVGVQAAPHVLNVQHSTSHSSAYPGEPLRSHQLTLNTQVKPDNPGSGLLLMTTHVTRKAPGCQCSFIFYRPVSSVLLLPLSWKCSFLSCEVERLFSSPCSDIQKPFSVQFVAPLQTFLSSFRVAWNILIRQFVKIQMLSANKSVKSCFHLFFF